MPIDQSIFGSGPIYDQEKLEKERLANQYIQAYYGNVPHQEQAGILENYIPLAQQFPNDSNIQRSATSFSEGIASLSPDNLAASGLSNPYNAALGQSLFDIFSLSQQTGGEDYLGNLLNQSYGSLKQGGKVSKYNVGGVSDLKPIQTEKYKGLKEVIVTERGDIFDVNATKSHDKMDDEEVTDLVGDSYVGSARDTYSLSKKEAEDISLGFGIVNYEEGMPTKMPEEMLLSDVVTKKKMKPAEIFNNIKKKFPVSSRKYDPISTLTDDENRSSRVPYLQATMELIEEKKDPKSKSIEAVEEFPFGGPTAAANLFSSGILDIIPGAQETQSFPSLNLLTRFMNSDNSLTGQLEAPYTGKESNLKSSSFNPVPSFQFAEGGYSKVKGREIPKADFGITAAIALGSTALNFFQNQSERRRANELFEENKQRIDENLDSNLDSLNAGSGFRIASILGQDTQFQTLDLGRVNAIGNQGFDNTQRIAENIFEGNANAIKAQGHNLNRTLFNNTSSFGQGVSAARANLPNTFRALNQNAANRAGQLSDIEAQRTNFNIGIAQTDAEQQQKKFLFEQEGRNQQIAGLGETAVNHTNQQANLNTGALNAHLANSGAQVAANQQFTTNNMSLLNSAAGILGTELANSRDLRTQQGNNNNTLGANLASDLAFQNTQRLSATPCPCRDVIPGVRLDCNNQPC